MGKRGGKPIYRPDIERLLPALNDSQIAREVGCSRERVRQIRKENGIPNPFRNSMCSPTIDEEKLTRIMERIRKGEWKAKIAREEGLGYEVLSNLLRKLKIDTPPTGFGKKEFPKEVLLGLRKNGLTCAECGKILGASAITISRRLREWEGGE